MFLTSSACRPAGRQVTWLGALRHRPRPVRAAHRRGDLRRMDRRGRRRRRTRAAPRAPGGVPHSVSGTDAGHQQDGLGLRHHHLGDHLRPQDQTRPPAPVAHRRTRAPGLGRRSDRGPRGLGGSAQTDHHRGPARRARPRGGQTAARPHPPAATADRAARRGRDARVRHRDRVLRRHDRPRHRHLPLGRLHHDPRPRLRLGRRPHQGRQRRHQLRRARGVRPPRQHLVAARPGHGPVLHGRRMVRGADRDGARHPLRADRARGRGGRAPGPAGLGRVERPVTG